MHEMSPADLAHLAAEVLESGNSVRFRALGGSMDPFIRDGDVVVVRPCAHIRLGDIVLCCPGEGRPVVHRIVGVQRVAGYEKYLLRGDAVRCADGYVTLQEVLGRVAGVERGAKFIKLDGGGLRLLGLVWAVCPRLCSGLYRAVSALWREGKRCLRGGSC